MADHAQILVSPSALARRTAALEWLARQPRDQPVLVVATTAEAAASLVRDEVRASGVARLGGHRLTLGRLATQIASPALVERGLVPVGALPQEALAATMVFSLAREERLGRFQGVAERPGLPRALARTLGELRLFGVAPDALSADPDVRSLFRAWNAALADQGFADRAAVFGAAVDTLQADEATHPAVGLPTLLLDAPVSSPLEQAFLSALAAQAPAVLATVPTGDDATLQRLTRALAAEPERLPAPAGEGSLPRVQRLLFDDGPLEAAELSGDVTVLSAPGESRECVEIARLILRHAAAGVPLDRIAVLLRTPGRYRAHLSEALARADLPAWFAPGTRQPDPAGRALLALLACAAEGLSARRFGEYLSLGELPDADAGGAPPRPRPREDRWEPPEEALAFDYDDDLELDDLALDELAEEDSFDAPADPAAAPVVLGQLKAPRRWEALIDEAAVIGGLDRWKRRLRGLSRKLQLDADAVEDPDGPQRDRILRDIDTLAHLEAFALPILEALAGLPSTASWGDWLDHLSALATRAVRRPERLLSVFAGLAPMAPVGPISLDEVRLVLGRRLSEVLIEPRGRPAGRVWVGDIPGARGHSFQVVLVPGLVEKGFPAKLVEDPILLDRARRALGVGLPHSERRAADERLQLRLAVGAAERHLVLSWPRIDVARSRPQVPSFYGLEVLRAAEGRLPGFAELTRRAERGGSLRVGWPAPADADHAIDEAEFDLAILERVLRAAPSEDSDEDHNEVRGGARYLVGANVHLARSLRRWARRQWPRWMPTDGLVLPGPPTGSLAGALAAHGLDARSFSATALQKFAECPYKFLLYTVHRLSPREQPEAIERMDPLQRGSLFHDVQFELLTELRDAGKLPLSRERLPYAQARLDAVLDRVAGRYRDDLAPAIDRVWEDGVAGLRADLREWLRRALDDPAWVPRRFELSFGLSGRLEHADEKSRPEPVPLENGIALRGAIDLVEESPDGALRATDHKTGKATVDKGAVIAGGRALQPVLYALALEQLWPGRRVAAGRLYYCTERGGFTERTIPLDPRAREAARTVARTIAHGLDSGFLPAFPGAGKDPCKWCDYRVVCGPDVAQINTRKPADDPRLEPLHELRGFK